MAEASVPVGLLSLPWELWRDIPLHVLHHRRQLRQEIDQLMENEHVSTDQHNISFILDVMLVKDIGVFPKWISFPLSAKSSQEA